MEGSLFLSAIICYVLLILLPLRTNTICLSTGLVQFYNSPMQGTDPPLFYTFKINPIVTSDTNSVSIYSQNLIVSLVSFSYDGTSNITCSQGSMSSTWFLLNCSGSATSVSYLIFNHAADVYVGKTSFQFNSSAINSGFYRYNL
jgi:hypothetical protein